MPVIESRKLYTVNCTTGVKFCVFFLVFFDHSLFMLNGLSNVHGGIAMNKTITFHEAIYQNA